MVLIFNAMEGGGVKELEDRHTAALWNQESFNRIDYVPFHRTGQDGTG